MSCIQIILIPLHSAIALSLSLFLSLSGNTLTSHHKLACQLKESDIRPHEIPSPKDSVFLADMRSHQESSKALREPGANFLEGVENDLRSIENSQNEPHSQNHLDERMTPHLSVQWDGHLGSCSIIRES